MIDESTGEYQSALDVDQRKSPRAQSIVVSVVSQTKLGFAAETRHRHEIEFGVMGGLHAILHAVAIRGEFHMQRAVVALQRREIAVGSGREFCARRTLRAGKPLVQHRLLCVARRREADA